VSYSHAYSIPLDYQSPAIPKLRTLERQFRQAVENPDNPAMLRALFCQRGAAEVAAMSDTGLTSVQLAVAAGFPVPVAH
jgi:hypothetical protein